MRLSPTLLVLLAACGNGGIQAKGTNDDPDDADGDGYDIESDCDDADPAVNPGAAEVCNGVDDDCDGLLDTVDDNLTDGLAAFTDGDGDGFGDPESPVVTCALGEGAVEDATDCDDSNSTTNPGATEQCATVADDDCDGDNNDEGAEGCIALYEDADGDGFGGEGTACICQPDEAHPAYFSEDCDDGDAAVNPDATEVCGNGLDDDCDGTPGECPLIGTLSLDSDGDASVTGLSEEAETGTQVVAPGDLDGDGRDDVVVLAPGGASAGAVGVVRGGWTGSLPLDDGDGLLLANGALDSIASVGDLDGDGSPDIAVGSRSESGGAGSVWIWTTPLGGDTNISSLPLRLDGEAGWGAGIVGGRGDVDGDGHADLLIAAPDEGDIFLVHGPVTAAAALSTRGTEVRGAGSGVSALQIVGDMDGDGLDDVVVGSPNRSSTGRAWVLAGPVSAVPSMTEADATISGVAGEDLLGAAVGAPGDLDGDGYADVLVGAPGVDLDGRDIGQAFLFHGPLTVDGEAPDLAAASMRGEFTGDLAGSAVAGGPDVDADGTPDFLIGAPGHDQVGSGAGLSYLVYGPLSGEVELKFSGASVEARNRRDASGTSVALMADANGDGFGDLLIGSPGVDDAARDAGAADLVFGDGL